MIHVMACDVTIHNKHPTGITSEDWITELGGEEKSESPVSVHLQMFQAEFYFHAKHEAKL
jgi:hypothetical protein